MRASDAERVERPVPSASAGDHRPALQAASAPAAFCFHRLDFPSTNFSSNARSNQPQRAGALILAGWRCRQTSGRVQRAADSRLAEAPHGPQDAGRHSQSVGGGARATTATVATQLHPAIPRVVSQAACSTCGRSAAASLYGRATRPPQAGVVGVRNVGECGTGAHAKG